MCCLSILYGPCTNQGPELYAHYLIQPFEVGEKDSVSGQSFVGLARGHTVEKVVELGLELMVI